MQAILKTASVVIVLVLYLYLNVILWHQKRLGHFSVNGGPLAMFTESLSENSGGTLDKLCRFDAIIIKIWGKHWRKVIEYFLRMLGPNRL